MSDPLELLRLLAINIAFIAIPTLHLQLLLFFDDISAPLICTWARVIGLGDGSSTILIVALLPCGTSSATGSVGWSPSAWCYRSEWSAHIVIAGTVWRAILLLNVCIVILIDNLDLDVNAAGCNLLIGCVSWWFIFRDYHVLREVEILIVCFDHVLPGRIFETLTLGLGKKMIVATKVWRCLILIDASLSQTTLIG